MLSCPKVCALLNWTRVTLAERETTKCLKVHDSGAVASFTVTLHPQYQG